MKQKLLLIIGIILIALLFIGCTCFDSRPIHPKILGTGYVQTDGVISFVKIGNINYPIKEVYSGKRDSRLGTPLKIYPIDGAMVTCYQKEYGSSVFFIAGNCSIQQIENIHKENYSTLVVMVFLGMFMLYVVFWTSNIPSKQRN